MKKKKQKQVKKEIQVLDWYNKYDSSWKGILVPESFAHPAKISFALSEAIYEFALEQGMIKSGDTVLDPFGGIAGTAFHAMLKGLRWVGVELEEKFVTLGNQNIESWNKKYSKVIRNWGNATLVRGDSRKLRKVLQTSEFAMVASSPPFGAAESHTGGIPKSLLVREDGSSRSISGIPTGDGYGSTVGQLGAMKEGEFEIAVSSPPYAETKKGKSAETTRKRVLEGKYKGKRPDVWISEGNIAGSTFGSGYADETEGNLGAMKEGSLNSVVSPNGNHNGNLKEGSLDAAISSPPYSAARVESDMQRQIQDKAKKFSELDNNERHYGSSDGNLSKMPDKGLDAVFSSPPYAAARIGESSAQEQVGHNGNYGNGDGQLGKMIEGEIEAVISSPPYADALNNSRHGIIDERRTKNKSDIQATAYGVEDGQLGAMKDAGFDLVVSSSPYPDSSANDTRPLGGLKESQHHGVSTQRHYGDTTGQLGAMPEGKLEGEVDVAISSPPFGQPQTRDRKPVQEGSVSDFMKRAYTVDRQGTTEDNLSAMEMKEVDVAVSSPPYERSLDRSENEKPSKLANIKANPVDYAPSNGNLGNNSGDTFWSASKLIVQEVHALLKDNGTAFWICKDFVRAKKIVPFCEQWMTLCESVGFETTHWIRAWQVKELGTQLALDGNHKTKKIERKSFFRRLHENKYPDTRIDYEVVIVMRKIPTEGKHYSEVTLMDLDQSIIDAAYRYVDIIDRIGRGQLNLNYERTEAHDEFITLLQHAHITGIGFDWDGRGNARELAERIVTWIRE